ncbi:hypothetical protein [Phytohabitans suffuscus]|nr:hypothetical protein [Phytohabitans suffuscus]
MSGPGPGVLVAVDIGGTKTALAVAGPARPAASRTWPATASRPRPPPPR